MTATQRCADPDPRAPIWAIADAKAGNRRQAEALAAALALRLQCDWHPIRLSPRAPWSWFAPRALPWAARRFDPRFAQYLQQHPPRLVVGCGRAAALATRIAREVAGSTAVQILDPRLRGAYWDLRIQPQHDPLPAEPCLQTLGSLHGIDDDWLRETRLAWPSLQAAPAPRIVCLLGGPTRQLDWGVEELRAGWALARRRAEASGGSLFLLASRRTPAHWREALDRAGAQMWWDDRDGPNPYPGWLAWADELWVSADSVNMLSEAMATAARVVLWPTAPARGRLARFHQAVLASGRVQTPGQDPATADRRPRRELAEVVEAVMQRLRLEPAA